MTPACCSSYFALRFGTKRTLPLRLTTISPSSPRNIGMSFETLRASVQSRVKVANDNYRIS